MSKNIIVTGGSRGIGKTLVEELAKENHVILNYNKSKKEAEAIKENLDKQGYEIEIVKADVSKRDEVKRLVNLTIEKYGKIDVVINNAGIDDVKLFTDITDEDWKHMMDVNLYSAFCVTQEVVKDMIRNKEGCIINISSVWGMIGASCETHYSVAKAGLDAMTKSLAKELGLSNIRINSIAPGIIDTQMNNHLTDKEREQIREEIPLGKIGKTIDIARCVKWLIEDEYTTGQVISVNGGWVIT